MTVGRRFMTLWAMGGFGFSAGLILSGLIYDNTFRVVVGFVWMLCAVFTMWRLERM